MKRYEMNVNPISDDRAMLDRRIDEVVDRAIGEDWAIGIRVAPWHSGEAQDSAMQRLGCASLAVRLLDRGVDRSRALQRIHEAFDQGSGDLGARIRALVAYVYACAVAMALRRRGIESLVFPRLRSNAPSAPVLAEAERIDVLPLCQNLLPTTAEG